MAEQRQGDIQRLVRSIVADLMSQEQNTPVEAATSNTSGNRYESIDQELNNSFRIPRGTSRENISGSINLNTAPNADANIAMNFNSRQNYARNQPQRKRQVVRQSATQSRKRNRTQTNDGNETYMKNVFLLPSPTWSTVPRREKKVFLQTHDLVVDAFRIDKRWNYEELKTEFFQLFSTVLQGEYESIGYVTLLKYL